MFRSIEQIGAPHAGDAGQASASATGAGWAHRVVRIARLALWAPRLIGAMLILPVLILLILFRPSVLHRAFVEGHCHDVVD